MTLAVRGEALPCIRWHQVIRPRDLCQALLHLSLFEHRGGIRLPTLANPMIYLVYRPAIYLLGRPAHLQYLYFFMPFISYCEVPKVFMLLYYTRPTTTVMEGSRSVGAVDWTAVRRAAHVCLCVCSWALS
jgi:hypothetical protein